MCVPMLWVCHTATKSRPPPMCQCVPERSWKKEEDGAGALNLGETSKAGHSWRQGKRQKPWDHKQAHKKRKALWLHLCLANWECNLNQSPCISYQLGRVAQLSQVLSAHSHFLVSLLHWAVALLTLTAALRWHKGRWQQWSQRLYCPMLLQCKFSHFQSQELPSDCSFCRLKMNCWHANALQPPSAGSVPVCSGKCSSAAQPCPCCAPGLTKGLFLLGHTKGFAMTVKNLSPFRWSTFCPCTFSILSHKDN